MGDYVESTEDVHDHSGKVLQCSAKYRCERKVRFLFNINSIVLFYSCSHLSTLVLCIEL